MNTCRRLDSLGIPALPQRAFIKEGGRIKPQGGSGGGSSGPTSQTVTQTNIPEWARPYAESMLGQGQALTDINQNPFQPYESQRFAGFSPMQAQAFQNVAGQQVAPQLADASNLAYTGAQQGLQAQGMASGLQQNALQYGGVGSQYGAMGAATAPLAQQYGATGAGIGGIGVQQAQQGFGAGQQYTQQATSPEAMQEYMSPYMQNVVDQQQREAVRQSQIQQQGIQSQAAQQGAFGGSRSAIVEAERQRNLATQLGDIQGAGLQKAYDQAQQAQQFGANLGIQGLQAGYGGLNVGLQGQQTGLQGIQTGLQGTAQGIQGAQTGLQGVGQATGAGQYGLAGSQLGVQGAGTLGNLGQTQYGQEMGITDAMQKYGALQQQQQQQGLDFAYQQEMAQQQYPYQQLSYMSDLLRGTPSTQSSVLQYQQQPNQTAQILGGGIAAVGALARKAGGSIPKSYADGGAVSPDAMSTTAVQALPAQLRRLSDTQLSAYARSVKDAITLSAIQNELSRRTKLRTPNAPMPVDTTAAEVAKRAQGASIGAQPMAGGGIVALQGGGTPAFSGVDEYGVDNTIAGAPPVEDPYTIGRGINAVREQMRTGPYSGVTTAGRGGVSAPPAPAPTGIAAAPTTNTTRPENVPMLNRVEVVAEAPANKTAPTAPRTQQPTSGTLTFDQFKAMGAASEPSQEDQAILADMRKRLETQRGRADKQSDNAAYDAIMMAGLAMMGGNSLADGIARAAQVGGPTYLAGKKDAQKAMDTAEDAQLAFDKYKMELRRGDEAAARKAFKDYTDYTTDLKKIDATLTAASISASRGMNGLTEYQIESLINRDPNVKAKADALTQAIASMDPSAIKIAEEGLATAQTQARNQYSGTAPAPTPTNTAQPMPTSKDALQKGVVYNTSRGPATWDGSQFTQ